MRGFEPPTPWSVAKCSIQLSYTHIISYDNKYLSICQVHYGFSLHHTIWPAIKQKSPCHTTQTTLPMYLQNYTLNQNHLHPSMSKNFRPWSSLRPISNSQLHTLLYFHPCPINLVVSKGSLGILFRGILISGGASRLDAFSVYPFRTWLLGHAPGGTTDTPVVRPARSSRTRASSPQTSYARAG